MKKETRNIPLLLIAALSLSMQVKAQNDSLVYTTPDISVYHTNEEWRSDEYNRLYWDLTKDGDPDILCVFTYNRNTGRIDIDAGPMIETYSMGYPDNLWMVTPYLQEEPLNSPEIPWIVTILGPVYGDYPGSDTTAYRPVAFRRKVDNTYYYGWFMMKADWVGNGMTFSIPESAYCTIPDYPLRWGQTSLNEGVEETDATAFATLHPNPTSGQVNITGKTLRQAEVVNLLGQRVATVAGDGDVLHIDMTKLPEGVYFVNITDGEGRKCVRKVVKE